jgi:anti-sigma-K factor RskA
VSTDPRRERLEDLLADRALVGLSAVEQAELAQLQAQYGAIGSDELEFAAAALDLALSGPSTPMPTALRTRLAAAAVYCSGPPTRPLARATSASAPRGRAVALAGWLLAAAALVVALLAWRTRAQGAPAPAALRAELLARTDTLRLEWTATELGAGAGGDVAWSQELQQGVLTIRGLAANDPARAQFQLWIFDDTQQHPVDGGVFDVAAGEVLIPIDAKLQVARPTLFAVTEEKPGGVVVSDQQRIVLVAKP